MKSAGKRAPLPTSAVCSSPRVSLALREGLAVMVGDDRLGLNLLAGVGGVGLALLDVAVDGAGKPGIFELAVGVQELAAELLDGDLDSPLLIEPGCRIGTRQHPRAAD